MPIDSTNEVLSCTKCGFLAKRKDLKNKNFFMNIKLNILNKKKPILTSYQLHQKR